jgi:hypothetical protein
MAVLDFSIVNVALPSMQRLSFSQQQATVDEWRLRAHLRRLCAACLKLTSAIWRIDKIIFVKV